MHEHRPENFAIAGEPADTTQGQSNGADVERRVLHGKVITIRKITNILDCHKNTSVKNKNTPKRRGSSRYSSAYFDHEIDHII
jgi:hypothetical protein